MKSHAKVIVGAIVSTAVLIITGVTVNLTSSSFETYCSPDPAMTCIWQMATGTRPERKVEVMEATNSPAEPKKAASEEINPPPATVNSEPLPSVPANAAKKPERADDDVDTVLTIVETREIAPEEAPKTFVGSWRGTYSCRTGDRTGTMQLLIESSDGRLTATEFYNRNGKTGSVHYVVDRLSQSAIKMTADRSNHTQGYEYAVILNLSDDGSKIEGQYVSHPNCSTIELFAQNA